MTPHTPSVPKDATERPDELRLSATDIDIVALVGRRHLHSVTFHNDYADRARALCLQGALEGYETHGGGFMAQLRPAGRAFLEAVERALSLARGEQT